jgi:transcription antitermination factor NusG
MSPVLVEEVNIYPTSLLTLGIEAADKNPADPSRQWWVIHTRARHEKAVARELYRERIPFYLPVIEKTRIYRGWRVTSRTPLFAGYVFLYSLEEERIKIANPARVSEILPVYAQDEMWCDLRQIYRLIASKAPLTVESRLGAGRHVRVRSGPLAGLEGIVIDRRERARLLVHVNFLQQGASVEIEDFMLEPLD